MSNRLQKLDVTKTRFGSRICLEVPQPKLGAVLRAIGAALDGLPFNPSRESKSRRRGKRGGVRNRERGTQMKVHVKHGTSEDSPATNVEIPARSPLVCPKPDSCHTTAKIDTTSSSSHSTTRVSNKGKANRKGEPSSAESAKPDENSSTHSYASAVSRESCGTSQTRFPASNQSCGFLDLVNQEQIVNTQRIGALRSRLREAIDKLQQCRVPKVDYVSKPYAGDYGILKSKSTSNWDKDVAAWKEYVHYSENGRVINNSIDADISLMRGDHFVVCDDRCKCKARLDPLYLTLLAAYKQKSEDKGDARPAVSRQRRPMGSRHS